MFPVCDFTPHLEGSVTVTYQYFGLFRVHYFKSGG